MMLEVSIMKESELHELLDIYSDPYISKIGHDHRPASIVVHPRVVYLSAKINDKIVGAFLAIRQTATDMHLHSLLKKEALPKSRELGKMCIDWAFSSNKEIQRVTANIIEGLEQAKNYCLKLGFVYEGRLRKAIAKDGKKLDIHILGITREEWSEL
jgi:hypothetical protein